MQPCCIEIWLIKASYDDEKWDAHNISQELQAWIKSTRKIQDPKQVIKSNKVLEEFKARIERKGNRKHKYLFRGSSHRSTPRLHLREGFPLSTEDAFTIWSTEDRAPSSTEYKGPLPKRLLHKERITRTKWSPQDHYTISQTLLQTLSLQLQLHYRMSIGFLALWSVVRKLQL